MAAKRGVAFPIITAFGFVITGDYHLIIERIISEAGDITAVRKANETLAVLRLPFGRKIGVRLIAQRAEFNGEIASGIKHLDEIHAIGSRIVSAVGDNERLFATEHHTRGFKLAIPAVVETGSSFQRIGLLPAAEALNPAVVASEREIRITVMFAAGAILGRQSDGERLPHILLHVHADERPIFPTHGDGIGIISLPSGWARFCNEISETAGINECAH